MTIAELGSLGELIAAVATIATLAYLAVQIRASARASAVESKLQTTRLMGDFTDPFIQNPKLNALFRQGLESFESLSADDSFVFYQLCLKSFWFLSAQHYQFRVGSLDEGEWHESRAVLHFSFAHPAGGSGGSRGAAGRGTAPSSLRSWTPRLRGSRRLTLPQRPPTAVEESMATVVTYAMRRPGWR